MAAGFNPKWRLMKIAQPARTARLAELIGIILGDGNIYIRKNEVYQTRIAFEAEKEDE